MTRSMWIGVALVVASAAVLGYLGLRASRGAAPTVAHVQALAAERDQLRDQLDTLLTGFAGLDIANVQPANILVGVPTSFASDVVNQLVTGLFSEVRVHLTGIETSAEGSVTVPVAGDVGSYSAFVEVKEVRAVVRPGAPELRFGDDRIGVRLPVTLAEGSGTAAVDVRWQSRGMAAVCGDLNVSTVISTGVQPVSLSVAGELQLAVVGGTLEANARSEAMTTRVWLQPTEQTWAALEATTEDIRKGLRPMCASAIGRLNTRGIVQRAIDRGFEVNVPAQSIDGFVLPARVETTVVLPDRTVTLEATPTNVRITRDALWYGVALAATSDSPPPAPQR